MRESEWLEQAIALAKDNVADGGQPFGALVVKDDRVLATGVNRAVQDNDPTAHAEVVAIRNACKTLGTRTLTGCTVVASCEPCPMCQAAAMVARVDRVLYAATGAQAAAAGFDLSFIHEDFRRPAAERRLRLTHHPSAHAAQPFAAWRLRSGS